MKRGAPLRRSHPKVWRRKDPVPEAEANYVYARDRGRCVVPHLDSGELGKCSGRLTLEHVKDQPMMGKRAPSDRHHMLVVCLGHNLGWCLTSAAKELERRYLRLVEAA